MQGLKLKSDISQIKRQLYVLWIASWWLKKDAK